MIVEHVSLIIDDFIQVAVVVALYDQYLVQGWVMWLRRLCLHLHGCLSVHHHLLLVHINRYLVHNTLNFQVVGF